MRARLECIPCYLRQTLRALRFGGLEDRAEEVLRAVMLRLTELDWSLTPMELGFEVYRVIREVTGVEDPYAEVKSRSNRLALSMLPRLREIVWRSSDPLRTAVLASIAGNIVDYGALESFDIEGTVNRVLRSKPAIDEYEELKSELKGAEEVLMFLDNAGEAAFDRLLAETIAQLYSPEKIVFVVKATPMINDVTLKDALEVGLNEVKGAEFREVPSSSLSDYAAFKPRVEEWIKRADVAISKGQGNYELLSHYREVFFLLTVKCNAVASDLGVRVGDVVIARGGR